jgi:hypothetical protein
MKKNATVVEVSANYQHSEERKPDIGWLSPVAFKHLIFVELL